jgi:drug/metabolite transporter (DMT)-like permease
MAKNVVGIGIAAIGTFTGILGSALNAQGNRTNFLGTLILLLTPLLWAVYTLAGKRIIGKYNPFLVVAYVNILGGPCLIPFSLAQGSVHEALTTNIIEWCAILYLAVTCSLLGHFILFHRMNQVKAAVTSSFMFAEPVITILFATAFVNVHIAMLTAAGEVAVFAAST